MSNPQATGDKSSAAHRSNDSMPVSQPVTQPVTQRQTEQERQRAPTIDCKSSISGTGLFAGIAFPAGTCVCIDTPLLTIDTTQVFPKQNQLLDQVKKLPRDRLEALVDLGRSRESANRRLVTDADDLLAAIDKNPEKARAAHFVISTFWADCFPPLPQQPVYRLFISASTLNHSCHPNAELSWHEDKKVMKLFALDNIEAGDEITVSYIPQYLPYEERAKRLDFQCTCSDCIALRDGKGEALDREEMLKELCEKLKEAKDFNRRFGHDKRDEPSMKSAIEVAISGEGWAGEMKPVIDAIELMKGLELYSSELSVLYDVAYLVNMSAYIVWRDGPKPNPELAKTAKESACIAKIGEVRHLSLCKGWNSADTQAAYALCRRLGAEDDMGFTAEIAELKTFDPER